MNSISGRGKTDDRAAASTRLASLRRFLEVEPDNVRLRRDVVDTAVAAGDFEYLRAFAESRLADVPADPEAQFDRATALMGLRDFAGALDALAPLDVTIPGVRFNLGFCLFMSNRYEDARPYFSAAYDFGDRSPTLLRFLILCLQHQGSFEAAIRIANDNEQVVVGDGNLAGTCALLFADNSDTANSSRLARIALASNPANLDALVTIGLLESLNLNNVAASAAFAKALEIQPANGRAWIGLASQSLLRQDFASAVDQFKRALADLPQHVGSWNALGWTHLLAGNLDEAENVLRHALELNRNFAENHGTLAVVAAMRGDRVAAERGIQIAERLDPDCMSIHYAKSLLAGPEAGRPILISAIARIPVHGPKMAALLRQAASASKS